MYTEDAGENMDAEKTVAIARLMAVANGLSKDIILQLCKAIEEHQRENHQNPRMTQFMDGYDY